MNPTDTNPPRRWNSLEELVEELFRNSDAAGWTPRRLLLWGPLLEAAKRKEGREYTSWERRGQNIPVDLTSTRCVRLECEQGAWQSDFDTVELPREFGGRAEEILAAARAAQGMPGRPA